MLNDVNQKRVLGVKLAEMDDKFGAKRLRLEVTSIKFGCQSKECSLVVCMLCIVIEFGIIFVVNIKKIKCGFGCD